MANLARPDATEPPAAAHVSPVKELLVLAVPTILQMLSYTVQQFTDVYMLSRVSDAYATSAVNAGMVTLCVISFGYGILMLVNAMVSHAFGAGQFRDCGRHLWQGIWLGVGYSVAMFPLVFVAEPIFSLMGHPPEWVPLEVSYFNITIGLLIVKMLALAVGQYMLAVNRPNIVLVSAVAGMLLNVVVNWLLIYGDDTLGMPAMGVAGAAWGTNAGVAIELVILGSVAFGPSMRRTYGTLAFGFDREKFFELMRVGVPSGFQMVGDVVAWTVFLAVIMPIFGPEAMAANGYMIQYMKVSFMPAFGLSAAVTALVARYMGAGQSETSEQRAHLGFQMALGYMMACGVVFLVLRNDLMQLFSDDPAVIALGGTLLVVCAVFQCFDAMFIMYSGALRGAKDTFVPSVVQIVLCWGVVVGGGYAVAWYFPEFGVLGPWIVGIVYGALLGTFMMLRFLSGRWKTLSPQDDAEAQHFDPTIAAAVEPLSQ